VRLGWDIKAKTFIDLFIFKKIIDSNPNKRVYFMIKIYFEKAKLKKWSLRFRLIFI
jgi:hypothetical protein